MMYQIFFRYSLASIFLISFFLSFSQISAQSAMMNAQKFNTLLNLIDRAYVDEVDHDMIVEAAIIKMLEELDPHSIYISKEDLQKMNEPLVGNFDGVGIQFNIYKDTILVVAPISGGPSEKLGIASGDKIVYIEEELMAGVGVKNKDVMERLRGEKGTYVKVSIYRRGVKDLLEFNIKRDKIPIYSVDAVYMVQDSTGYIKVNRFAANTLLEFNQGLDSLKGLGMKNLILDLRGNSGGYLKTAEKMADMFLNGGKLIVYTEGRSQPRIEMKASAKGSFEDGKLIILIDEGSASASEILAGAVQDWDRGLIVGRRSFGKGLVQKPYNLPDGSAVRLTISRYYTPSGRSIQKPYDDGKEAYNQDASERYKHGEYFTLDSIKMNDSLKYFTKINNRMVYGGGGILPDVFVPLDTSYQTKLYRDLLRKGIYNYFTIDYMDLNRKKLKKKYSDLDDFNANFDNDDAIFEAFKTYALSKEIEFKEEDVNTSADHVRNLLKAYFARNLYGSTGFFKVLNEKDNTFVKALNMFYDQTFEEFKLVNN